MCINYPKSCIANINPHIVNSNRNTLNVLTLALHIQHANVLFIYIITYIPDVEVCILEYINEKLLMCVAEEVYSMI